MTEPTVVVPAKRMSVGGAIFLGVGAMVGAGIFALFGEAGLRAGSATWLSFLLGAIVALLLGYTVTKLSERFPSRGGVVSYLHQGFGDSHLTGAASWLFYIAGMIVTSMVALSFGSYARALLLPDDSSATWAKVFTLIGLAAMCLLFGVGPAAVGRVQSALVVVNLAVFAVFIVVTINDADFSRLAFSTYPPLKDIVASVALTFFAYLGFAVVATTAESIDNPRRNVPVATYLALLIAGTVYVLISIGVYGTLSVDAVIAAGDTALAEAAKPSLGQAGYTMMAISALLATAGATNANLFAAGNLTSNLAQTGEFPEVFGRALPVLGTAGVAITAGIVATLTLFFDLSTIASVGSAVALMIFTLVVAAGMRLRRETGSNLVVLILAMTVTVVVLALFLVDTARTQPRTLAAMAVAALAAVGLDVWWKSRRSALELAPPLERT